MSIFGDLERFLSEDLYPYRWPLAIAFAGSGVAFLAAVWRQGWHRWIWEHRTPAAIIGVPLMAIAVAGSYPLVSPLFERNTVCEASPVAGAGAGSEKCEGELAVAATNTSSPAATTAASTPGASPATSTAALAFEARAVLQGKFRNADDFHTGSGDALIIETAPQVYTLRFENFSVRNGPDLFVFLSTTENGDRPDALNLGALKGTDGAFNYEIPAGTDVSQYQSVIVWCEPFDVLFTVAPLIEA